MKILSLSTLRELFHLAIPMVVSQGAFAVMIFCDRWFMSHLDAAHIAATMGGGVASFFCISLFMGVITYANALVAQYYGTGNLAKCPRVVTQGLLLAVACIPVLLPLAVYGGMAFSYLDHDPAQVPLEQQYFQILMSVSFFSLVKACLASYFAGIGRTRLIMIADLCSVLLNIPLSWALVFGRGGLPELGIAGAALGTAVASLFGVCIYLAFYLARAHRQQFSVGSAWQFDAGIMRRYLRLGIPAGLESFLNMASFNLFLLLFQAYGVTQGAAMAIVFNWDMLSFVPMIGLNIAVTSLIGRFVGMRDMGRANQVISSGFILALGYAGALVVVFLVYRMEMVDVFRTPQANFAAIRELAGEMMLGLCTYMLADATIQVSSGTLRGAGDTRWVMITSVTLHWLMLFAQYYVIAVRKLEPLVSWWIMVAMIIALALAYLQRLLRGRWRAPERLDRIMRE
jgi:MATE family multidrug resistance protein